jgi:hypothetical protein
MPWWHIGGMGVQLHSFLTSALDGGDAMPHTLVTLCPGERAPVPTEIDAGWATDPV